MRKAEQQHSQTSGSVIHQQHHDVTTPTLSSLSKQTKTYNNTLISNNNNNLIATINESRIPIVRDEGKPSSRLSHHLHHMTLRGRSKIRVRSGANVETHSQNRSNLKEKAESFDDNTVLTDTNSNHTMTEKSCKSSKVPGITLELSATPPVGHPSGIPVNTNNNNNTVKRYKRSLSSTRLEKDKCDEYNTKLLRKASNATSNNNNIIISNATASPSASSNISSASFISGSNLPITKSSSLSRKLGSTNLPSNNEQNQNVTVTSSSTNATGTSTCSRLAQNAEQSSLKLRKKISY